MNSEERYKYYNFIVNVLILTYSFALICLSIYQGHSENTQFPEFLQLIVTVGVFTLSAIAFGANFHGKAAHYRECYLRLGKLYNSDKDEKTLQSIYDEILQSYQNHRRRDYQKVIISAKVERGQELRDSDDKAIVLSKWVYFRYYLASLRNMVGIIICFMPPVLIIIFIAADYLNLLNGS